jgi:hypothetical protein
MKICQFLCLKKEPRCPLLAQSKHELVHCTCPFALHLSASDPKRTWADLQEYPFKEASWADTMSEV